MRISLKCPPPPLYLGEEFMNACNRKRKIQHSGLLHSTHPHERNIGDKECSVDFFNNIRQ